MAFIAFIASQAGDLPLDIWRNCPYGHGHRPEDITSHYRMAKTMILLFALFGSNVHDVYCDIHHKKSTNSTKGRSSTMTVKKSNPVSRPQISETCPKNQGSRSMPSSQKLETHGHCQGYAQRVQNCSAQSSSMIKSNQRAPCDADRISQWAAASATGLEYPAFGPSCTTYGTDMSLTSVAPPAPGAFSVPHSDDFQFSSYAMPMEQAYVPDISYEERSTYNAGAQFSRMTIGQDVVQGQGLSLSTCFDGQNSVGPGDAEVQSYILPAGNEFTMETHPLMGIRNNTNGYDSYMNWNVQALHDVSGANIMGSIQPTDWSSSSAMTPSTSSLPSEHSFLSQPPDTPVSATMFDGSWIAPANGPTDGEFGMGPSFTIGETAQIQPAVYYDDQSTIRQNQPLTRAPLTMDTFSAHESQAYGLPQYPLVDGSRRGSDGENRNARDHPFYKVEAHKDGLYHCPFVTTDECTHKPEKLKCNYDKHLDSHLKPYRCHKYGCAQVQFSSTACLLRHEREAHGMHGHGEKPHLCIFKDCDRSAEDNGFPRRWNLFDHMKRVHDYDPPNKGASPPSSTGSRSPPHGSARDAPKKRRTPSPTLQAPSKKVKIAAPQAQDTASRSAVIPNPTDVFPGNAPQTLNGLWYEQINQIQTRLHSLDPTNPSQWEQYQADMGALNSIGLSIQYQQQAHVAH